MLVGPGKLPACPCVKTALCRHSIWLLKNIHIHCLLRSFSGRDIKASSKQRGAYFFASYLNTVSLLNLTSEIVDRLFNAYQTDLPRKVDFEDEAERWEIGWALSNDKPETTRHYSCNKPWLIPGSIQHHLYLTDNPGVIDNNREICQCN
jgi:hypothetical protein